MEATRKQEYSTEGALYVAFELGQRQWKLGCSVGVGQAPRERTIDAGDLVALGQELQRAQAKLGVAAGSPILSCYEAGLDGFWLHRYLTAQGITNVVVDSASIAVDRRAKRAKTDRLDVHKLVTMLIRYYHGEAHVWRVVHVPSVAAEDQRHLHRQLLSVKRDEQRHRNRIYGVLASQGVQLKIGADFLERVAEARQWDGAPLPEGLQARVRREYQGLQFVQAQREALQATRTQYIATAATEEMQQVRQLLSLRGIGENSAWLLVMEFFGWRAFRNRRELGALAGLTPTPYQSGDSHHEQGISKAGNRHVRRMMVEIAWCWLRFQPDSALTQWYRERYGNGPKRMHRIGVVALARKLLIALWRFLEEGEVPSGAQLKPVS
ncbi:MAG: IS110 family transposase [Anaerolineae bacterium]|jgi:transposase|nr:IS110 family transposase [Anaerolineae bacterium]